MRINMRVPDDLDKILREFISFKNDTVYQFEDAIENFKADIPNIIETLRKRIEESGSKNTNFISTRNTFLELCRAEINPEFTLADIREMMIQHILTSDIFNKIFDDPEFHHHNTIAAELEKLIGTLFTYSERKNLLGSIEHYYDTINATAAGIVDHHEKQKFLKVLYENFYKVYNPKAADRLGVVYTPNEIVKFRIESTDYLLHKHFNKTLADDNVEILDPATGTGTFICDIIEHIPKQHLVYKYKNELHANDVAILPYYIANLNIEFTFKQKMGYYEEFTNSCFVDTLDNTGALAYTGKQHSLFGLSHENAERIRKQNTKKISVIIGNPPYNANQANYNDFNKNRSYPDIDKRIKETFVKYSRATNKANLYDMYVRFYRWSMDRIDKNGIICLITNNSFINNKAFDGFRKIVEDEFDSAYIIDLGGNIRELSGKDGIWLNEENTIFGVAAAVGIAIMFLVKQSSKDKLNCIINYIHPCDIRATRMEKLEWINSNNFRQINFDRVNPKNNNWLNHSDNDFETLMPLIDKDVKAGKKQDALFSNFSLGIASHRDGWVYDFSEKGLEKKLRFFINVYNQTLIDDSFSEKKSIAWDSDLNNLLRRKLKIAFEKDKIISALFRPYCKKCFYFDKQLNARLYQFPNIYEIGAQNHFICIRREGNSKPFHLLATSLVVDLHTTGDSQCLPLYRFVDGNLEDNITEWGLQKFVEHYKDKIAKEEIFHYVYAVLHHPTYHKKYELNLKREFPRIPFYNNFQKWAEWGNQLMELHVNYETVEPYDLKLHQHEQKAESIRQKKIFQEIKETEALYARQPKIKPKLKAVKKAGIIELDELSFLTGVPKEAWDYKLGNRSALEWILDQYKEKKPSDPTIAEKFNTYRFADYKEKVIDLLKRVCTVSVETMKIINEMPQ
ncbi:MAG: type ISP restriction/modification enzyme [Chitinophagales bacterium]